MSKMGQELERKLDENKYELLEAVKVAIEDLKIYLGEWISVTYTYSPEWTHAIKRTISDLEQVLAKIEGGK